MPGVRVIKGPQELSEFKEKIEVLKRKTMNTLKVTGFTSSYVYQNNLNKVFFVSKIVIASENIENFFCKLRIVAICYSTKLVEVSKTLHWL